MYFFVFLAHPKPKSDAYGVTDGACAAFHRWPLGALSED